MDKLLVILYVMVHLIFNVVGTEIHRRTEARNIFLSLWPLVSFFDVERRRESTSVLPSRWLN